MRYVVLLSLVFLTGCFESADTYGVRVGDFVTVEKGFYTGCMGTITDYDDWNSSDDDITIKDVVCKNVTINFIRIKANNLKKK